VHDSSKKPFGIINKGLRRFGRLRQVALDGKPSRALARRQFGQLLQIPTFGARVARFATVYVMKTPRTDKEAAMPASDAPPGMVAACRIFAIRHHSPGGKTAGAIGRIVPSSAETSSIFIGINVRLSHA
jgi:hypothetical protein